jgi:hypothetical protein
MRPAFRIAAWAAAAVVALYLGAASIVPRVVAADAWRGRIEERLSAVAGRPVALGTLRLNLWTGIAVRADRIAVGGTPSIEAGEASVGIAWGPLLRREIRPRWIAVDGATIRRGAKLLVEDSRLRARLGREADGGTSVTGRIEGRVAALRDSPPGELDFSAVASGDRLDVGSFVARVGAHVIEARATIDGVRGPAQRVEAGGAELEKIGLQSGAIRPARLAMFSPTVTDTLVLNQIL